MKTVDNILFDMQQARQQVMALCGFTEEELNLLQWEAALECLRKVLRSDEYGIYELPKNADFWLWWKDQWYRIDEKFLSAMTLDITSMKYCCLIPGQGVKLWLQNQAQTRQAYLSYHRISSDNPLVNNELIEVSFHKMIKDLTKTKQ